MLIIEITWAALSLSFRRISFYVYDHNSHVAWRRRNDRLSAASNRKSCNHLWIAGCMTRVFLLCRRGKSAGDITGSVTCMI